MFLAFLVLWTAGNVLLIIGVVKAKLDKSS
jgi:hypothetical protein